MCIPFQHTFSQFKIYRSNEQKKTPSRILLQRHAARILFAQTEQRFWFDFDAISDKIYIVNIEFALNHIYCGLQCIKDEHLN